MINGAHVILYSKNPEADRGFLRDVLKFPHVDVGEGWLIFGLPASEVAVHPSKNNDVHEFYLMCDDVEAFVAEMARSNIDCAPRQNMGWGVLTRIKLPGGGELGVYQPRHARPKSPTAKKPAAKKAAAAPGSKPTSAARKPAANKKR